MKKDEELVNHVCIPMAGDNAAFWNNNIKVLCRVTHLLFDITEQDWHKVQQKMLTEIALMASTPRHSELQLASLECVSELLSTHEVNRRPKNQAQTSH